MSVSAGGGRGKGKSLEAELNLTSFIDLLSTIVCFLLVSSVWVQISSLDLKQSHGTDGGAATETAALDVDFQGPGKAFLTLKKGGKVLQKTSVSEATHKRLVESLNLAVISMKQIPALKNAKIESV
jgi:biopolymer transport protein ExbD